MAQQFARIEQQHKSFIEAQKIFFVASAAPTGRVNVSPKGMASFAVLGDNDVAYLDCTGSGSETRAHLIACEDRRGQVDEIQIGQAKRNCGRMGKQFHRPISLSAME